MSLNYVVIDIKYQKTYVNVLNASYKRILLYFTTSLVIVEAVGRVSDRLRRSDDRTMTNRSYERASTADSRSRLLLCRQVLQGHRSDGEEAVLMIISPVKR